MGARGFIIAEKEFTYGYALNYGIERVRVSIICCLSAHCIPCNDSWLYHLTTPIIEGIAHATFGKQVPRQGINPFERSFSL